MHGLIVNQLRSFALARYGRPAWAAALQVTNGALTEAPPPLDVSYPDDLVLALVGALARDTGSEVFDFLVQFGTYLAEGLLRVYQPLIRPHWRTLDIVEHVEEHVHTAVRLRDRNAGPPYLSARRRSDFVVEVVYTSPRRLCALAEGIVRGLAAHFDEDIAIHQPECMLRGDDHCLIVVRREARAGVNA